MATPLNFFSRLTGDVLLTSPARGDVLYRGASRWNNLAAGTAGRLLRTAGAGADPAWTSVLREANSAVGVGADPTSTGAGDLQGLLQVTHSETSHKYGSAVFGRKPIYDATKTNDLEYAQAVAHFGTDSATGITLGLAGFGDTGASPYSPCHVVTLRGRGSSTAPTSALPNDHLFVLEVNGINRSTPGAGSPRAYDYTNVGALTCLAATDYDQGIDARLGLWDSPGYWRFTLADSGKLEAQRAVWVAGPKGQVYQPQAVPATANYGLLSLGGDPAWDNVGSPTTWGGKAWDGTTAGHFAGSSGGTFLAGWSVSTFAGYWIDFQREGTRRFALDANGNLYDLPSIDTTANYARVSLGNGGFGGGGAPAFTGSASGNWIGINVGASSFAGDWINAQCQGVSAWRVSGAGKAGLGASAPDLDHWFGVGPRFTDSGFVNMAGHFGVDGDEASLLLTGFTNNAGEGPGFYAVRGRGTHAAKASAQVGDLIGHIEFESWNSSDRRYSWELDVVADTNFGSDAANTPVYTSLKQRGDGIAIREVWRVGAYGYQQIPLAPQATGARPLFGLGNGGFGGGATPDFQGNGSGCFIGVNAAAGYGGTLMELQVAGVYQFYVNASGKALARGGIGVGNSAAGSTLGTVTKKIEVFDANGASLGFLPVYNTIT